MDHIWTLSKLASSHTTIGSDDDVAKRNDRCSRAPSRQRVTKRESVQTRRTCAASLRTKAYQGLSGSDEGDAADGSGQYGCTVHAFLHPIGDAPGPGKLARVPPSGTLQRE